MLTTDLIRVRQRPYRIPEPTKSTVKAQIEKMFKARYISTTDLTKGYWQIRLDDEAMHKSSLVSPFSCCAFWNGLRGCHVHDSDYEHCAK